MSNPLRQLQDFGQSVWLDYISRGLLRSGQLRTLIEQDGIRGVTSNPTIFEKAISGSDDYDQQLRELADAGASVSRIYEELTVADIRAAADELRPVYDASQGMYGFVSYEVPPALANDTSATVETARRYFSEIDRPNLMVKVPSTPAGIPAVEQLIADGRNINITLMFSVKHYEAVAEAYIRGLERRAAGGQALDRVASVASVFISRIDTLVDKRLSQAQGAGSNGGGASLAGKAGVANTKLIYQKFKQMFGGDRFKALAARGARLQQPLWASTGTKNPAYSDIKYVQELIAPDTVNTMPQATMDAFRDHGQPASSIEDGIGDAREVVQRLAALGIDMNAVGDELQREGVGLFAKSFDDLQSVIESKRGALIAKAAAR